MDLQIEGMPLQRNGAEETAGRAEDGVRKWMANMDKESEPANPTPEEAASMRDEIKKIDRTLESLQAKIDGIVAKIQAGQKTGGRPELKALLTEELNKEKLGLAKEIETLRSREKVLSDRLKFVDDIFMPKDGEASDTPPFTYQ